jgi:S-adenosylmethionine synthetase
MSMHRASATAGLDPSAAVQTGRIFSSESVTEGHPDKVCDFIADSILDAHLGADRRSRVACEVLAKGGQVVLAGEITSGAGSSGTEIDLDALVRRAIQSVGYTDPAEPFAAETVRITKLLTQQAAEISQGVTATTSLSGEQGAGDQGLMFGYATDETHELMPLPIVLAHGLTRGLAADRKSGSQPWLRPDGKSQVSVEYLDGRPQRVTAVVVSCQHARAAQRDRIVHYVKTDLLPRVLGRWNHDEIVLHVNPTGSFVEGGPGTDAGVTGRKIIVDTYGGMARHGGGAFSGKDPSKVDRSAAYFCRFVARQVVRERLAHRAELQVAYAIGQAQPVSIHVETFGTGNGDAARRFVLERFDFRPAAIIERLGLLRPIYAQTTNYGHFGRPGLPWEE